MQTHSNYALFKNRRDTFLGILQSENPEVEQGLVILFAGFEDDRYVFRQESSFHYLTGIHEPGCVLFLYFDGREVLYVPHYAGKRKQWVTNFIEPSKAFAKKISVEEVKHLGLPCSGYSLSPLPDNNHYMNVLNDLSTFMFRADGKVFTLADKSSPRYIAQLQIFNYLAHQFSGLSGRSEDCSYIVHELRRFKDDYELDCLYKASHITTIAHNAAAGMIAPGKHENEVQAMIESIFTMTGAMRPAFPSIVATGKNTTILHYTDRDQELKDGDLVVVDIGAEFSYYAADITRTYPVSGKFTPRQREVYNIVLDTQNYLESRVTPGIFLNNPQESEKSLQHIVIKYLKKYGYDAYFSHGVGHHLGLDVHDVGDIALPLDEGNVIALEPGIYIPEENIGIRIEDNYVVIDGGCLQLSHKLPKTVDEIESIMRQQ